MGIDAAPIYSTLTVGYMEVKMYSLWEQRWGLEIKHFIYENLSRFLDDCELPLEKTKIEPEELLGVLSSNFILRFNSQWNITKEKYHS